MVSFGVESWPTPMFAELPKHRGVAPDAGWTSNQWKCTEQSSKGRRAGAVDEMASNEIQTSSAPPGLQHFHQVTDDLRTPYRDLTEAIPATLSGFNAMGTAAMAEGALSARMKQLIALAIAISKECDGCISDHARGAARRGATNAEVVEMIAVAILMNGGPGTVWGARALAAFHEFVPN
jgi:AhpD family alkylhydroperoxidase